MGAMSETATSFGLFEYAKFPFDLSTI